MQTFETEPYIIRMLDNIDHEAEKAIWKIKHIDTLSEDEAKHILTVLIKNTCHSQNITPIVYARKRINEIPKKWLVDNFIDTAIMCIEFDDDWDYRRLLELIKVVIPEFLNWAIHIGLQSNNPEVVEAANDFLIKPFDWLEL